MIFVFGSNLAGIHGAGAAATAKRDWGATHGIGIGHQGQSYAIPTKDAGIRTMTLKDIKPHVKNFTRFASLNPHLMFQVTRVGCGLAGLKDSDMAPMFKWASENCFFDTAWYPFLGNEFNYWGHVP